MISFGFSTTGCPDYTIDRIIDAARQGGYSGIELRFLRGSRDLTNLDELSPALIGETRRRFDDAGVTVVGIGTSIRMSSLDAAVRASQLEEARLHLAMAESLGASYLRLFGGPLSAEQDRERTLDAIAAGLTKIGDMTVSSGVTSLVETHDAFCRSDSITDLYKRGMGQSVKVLWDTLHTFRNGESAEESWARLGPNVRLVHVKDARRATPDSFDCALTGEGVVPIRSFIDVLQAGEYDGYINFEWEKAYYPDIAEPEVALPHFMQFIRKVLPTPAV